MNGESTPTPENGAYTGTGGNVAATTGTAGGPGGPVQQGTDNLEGSKLTPGEPKDDGQKVPEVSQDQQPEQ